MHNRVTTRWTIYAGFVEDTGIYAESVTLAAGVSATDGAPGQAADIGP
jgi:hypothetical protein